MAAFPSISDIFALQIFSMPVKYFSVTLFMQCIHLPKGLHTLLVCNRGAISACRSMQNLACRFQLYQLIITRCFQLWDSPIFTSRYTSKYGDQNPATMHLPTDGNNYKQGSPPPQHQKCSLRFAIQSNSMNSAYFQLLSIDSALINGLLLQPLDYISDAHIKKKNTTVPLQILTMAEDYKYKTQKLST